MKSSGQHTQESEGQDPQGWTVGCSRGMQNDREGGGIGAWGDRMQSFRVSLCLVTDAGDQLETEEWFQAWPASSPHSLASLIPAEQG